MRALLAKFFFLAAAAQVAGDDADVGDALHDRLRQTVLHAPAVRLQRVSAIRIIDSDKTEA